MRGPGQRPKCPTCAEKDAQIALIDKNRDIIVADYERDRRAAKARATAAEQERDRLKVDVLDFQLRTVGLESKLAAAEQERDKVTTIAERFEMDLGIARAKLAVAERREAEKDAESKTHEAAMVIYAKRVVVLEAALRLALPHVESQADAEHMLDGFGPRQPRDSDRLVARIHAALASPSTPSPAPSAEPDDWSVSVSRSGENLVTIEPRMLSGRPTFSVTDEAAIRAAGHHLLAFIGSENPEPFIVDDEAEAQPSPPPRSAPREAGEPHEAGEPKDTRRDCTCLGTCKGPEGLGPRWRCVMGREKPAPVAASEPKEPTDAT
jgi:hypothetical protein